jgi:uncharacterized protein (TIGR01244 family)
VRKIRHAALVVLSAVTGCTSSMPAPNENTVMEEVLKPAPGIVTNGRLNPEDIIELQQAGIEHVIDLTPDAETPDFDEATVVEEAGIAYSNLPVRGALDLTFENVVAFDEMMRDSKRSLLVHCASGNRVGAMAALRAAWIDGKSEDEAVMIGKAWGLKGLEAEVRERMRRDQRVPRQ